MKPTHELFDLIKSLNGSEKRYFKLTASLQKGNKNYLKLFDAIDEQESYDEKRIRTKYRNENFIKNLTFIKNYLYKLIFRSLNSYHNEKSIDARINSILTNSRLLFNKALFEQFFKTVQYGKKLAEKFERFTLLIEFLEIERQLTKKEDLAKKSMDQLFDEEEEVINKLKTINEYKRAVSRLLVLSRVHGIVRDKLSDYKIEAILLLKIFKSESEATSLIAKERFYFALYIGAALKGDFKTSYEYNKKRVQLIHDNKDVFHKFIFDNYEEALLTLIISAAKAGKYKEADNILVRYNKLFAKNAAENFDLTITHYIARLIKNMNDDVFETGLAASIEKFLMKYRGKLNIDIYNEAYFNLSKYFLMSGDQNEALRIINILFDSKYLKHTLHIEPAVRLHNILIHFEMKNYKLIPHLVSANLKYLKRKNKLYSTEKTVLKFLNTIIKVRNEIELKEKFRILNSTLKNLQKNKYEKNASRYLDLIKWSKNFIIKFQ